MRKTLKIKIDQLNQNSFTELDCLAVRIKLFFYEIERFLTNARNEAQRNEESRGVVLSKRERHQYLQKMNNL